MPTKKTTAIEKQQPKAGEIVLNLDNIRKYIAPTATVTECEEFQSLCVVQDLNPFPPQPEVHFIKYDKNKPPTFVVAYMVYLKRAERQKKLKGWIGWTEEGADPATGKRTMKACIEIHRKDWDEPFYHEVYWEEYAQYRKDYKTGREALTRFWKEKPRTMLKKVVIGQGFRMCFPDEMGGLPYTSEEMPEALPAEPIIEAVVEEESAPKKKPKELPKPKVKKKPTLTTAKKPTVIPDTPPELLDDGEPKIGISKEEHDKLKKEEIKMDEEAVETLNDIDPIEESEPGEDGEAIALRNAIEQKLNLLEKHYGRPKIKLIEKIHLVLSNKFGVTVAKFPDDLSKEQLTYTLELLQVTVDNEEKKKGKKNG